MAKKNLNNALNATDKFFSATNANKEDTHKPENKKAPVGEKIVFSFRSPKNSVESWRIYANVKGMKVEELGAAALDEYIKKHPLSEEEQAVFNTLLANKMK